MWNNLKQCALELGSTVMSTEPMSPHHISDGSEAKTEQIME